MHHQLGFFFRETTMCNVTIFFFCKMMMSEVFCVTLLNLNFLSEKNLNEKMR